MRTPRVRAYGQRPAAEAYVERLSTHPAFQKAHADQLADFAAADQSRNAG
ncbi:MAG: hypothetical protein NTX73_10785 [Rhodobacterales bacterium]|nr:hypothetical protein [Rhodobacterales bacterium]